MAENKVFFFLGVGYVIFFVLLGFWFVGQMPAPPRPCPASFPFNLLWLLGIPFVLGYLSNKKI